MNFNQSFNFKLNKNNFRNYSINGKYNFLIEKEMNWLVFALTVSENDEIEN